MFRVLKYGVPAILFGLLFSGIAYAVNVTVPQAQVQGQIPIGLSTGNYSAGNLVAGSGVTISTTTPGQITFSSSGALSGGTPGYVANWTSGTTLSTGTLLDNGVAGVNATSSTVAFNIQGTGAIDPLQVGTSTNTSMLFVQGSTGRVGIGTTSPTDNLTVAGSSRFAGSFTETTTNIGVQAGVISGTPRVLFANGTAGQNWEIDNSSGTFRWFLPGIVHMSLSSTVLSLPSKTISVTGTGDNYFAGKIGIATTTPSYLLDAVGTGVDGALAIRVKNTSNAASQTADFRVENDLGYSGRFSKFGSNYGTYKIITNNDLAFYNESAGNISILNNVLTGDILFSAGASSVAHLAINDDGFIGVGTTTPTSKLTVIGSGTTLATSAFEVTDSVGSDILFVRNDNSVGIGTSTLTAGGSVLTVAKTNTNVTATRIMSSFSFDARPTANTSATYQPMFVSLNTRSDFNYNGLSTALNATVNHNTTSTMANMGVGIYNGSNIGAGTVTAMTILSLTPKNTGTGTTTTATGLSVIPTVSAGSMGTFIGVNVPATTAATNNYSALFGNRVGIGTTTPAYLLDINNGNATTTIQIDTTTSKGACLKLKDADGSGYTYCSVNNGTMTCSTGSCE